MKGNGSQKGPTSLWNITISRVLAMKLCLQRRSLTAMAESPGQSRDLLQPSTPERQSQTSSKWLANIHSESGSCQKIRDDLKKGCFSCLLPDEQFKCVCIGINDFHDIGWALFHGLWKHRSKYLGPRMKTVWIFLFIWKFETERTNESDLAIRTILWHPKDLPSQFSRTSEQGRFCSFSTKSLARLPTKDDDSGISGIILGLLMLKSWKFNKVSCHYKLFSWYLLII